MNAHALARPLQRHSFTAWRLLDGDKLAHGLEPLWRTLPEIEMQIAIAANHGSTILVLQTDALADAQMLHAYRIRKGKWDGGYCGNARTYRHHADKLFALPVTAFEPSEPWKVTRGGDYVGAAPVIDGAFHGEGRSGG